jgi:hypothetical protein
MGKNVQASQRKDQKHLGRPSPDALYRSQLLNDSLIREAAYLPKIDSSILHIGGKIEDASCLLRGDTNRAKLFKRESHQAGCCKSIRGRKFLQPLSDRPGRSPEANADIDRMSCNVAT